MIAPTPITEEREQFEAWVNSRPGTSLRSGFDGSLDYPLGNIIWETWQAARRAAPDVRAIRAAALEEAAQAVANMRSLHAPGFDYTRGIEHGLRISEAAIRALAAKKDET